MDGHRRYIINQEKKRRRNEWVCLITYFTMGFIIILYLGGNLNLFFRILFSILTVILLIIGSYLIHKIFFKKKRPRNPYIWK